jgi:hypothetical protein
MAWTYLVESVDSLSPCPSGSNPWPTVKSTDTLRVCCCHEWPKINSGKLPSGTTCERCGATPYPLSTLSMVASPARISALQGMAQAWQESEAAYSLKSPGCVANYDPLSSSWKTCQQSLLAEGGKWSEPLPRWGMMRDGALYPLPAWGPTTSGNDGSYLPTPTASNTKTVHLRSGGRPPRTYWPTPRANNGGPEKSKQGTPGTTGINLETAVRTWPTPRAQDGKHGAVTPTDATRRRVESGMANLPEMVVESSRMFPTPKARDWRSAKGAAHDNRNSQDLNVDVGGPLNPPWVEWLMGYPIGWTVLPDWATQWFRSKRGRRLKSSQASGGQHEQV